MVITEEIIAAYIEGKISKEERKEVLRYLATSPDMQDVVLVMMDDCDCVETKPAIVKNEQMQVVKPSAENTLAAAAFVPRIMKEKAEHRNWEDSEMYKRQKNILSFLDEIDH